MDKVEDLKGMLRRPGPSKAVWDEALRRSGIDPSVIAEYNLPEDGQSDVTVEKMNEVVAEMGSRAARKDR